MDFFCTGVRPRAQDGRELCADVADLDCGRVAARELLDPHAHLVDGVKMTSNASPSRSEAFVFAATEQIFELCERSRNVGESQHQRRALDAVRTHEAHERSGVVAPGVCSSCNSAAPSA
jgi:hypothetical protein